MPLSLAGGITSCKMRLFCLMCSPSPGCRESSPAMRATGLSPPRKVCSIDCHTGSYIFTCYSRHELMYTCKLCWRLCEKELPSKTEGKVGDASNYMHLFHQSVLLVRSLTAKSHSDRNLIFRGFEHLMSSCARGIFQLLHQSLFHLPCHHHNDKFLFMACSIFPDPSGRKFPFLSHCRTAEDTEQEPPPCSCVTVQFYKISVPAWGQNCSLTNSINIRTCLLNLALCKLQVNLYATGQKCGICIGKGKSWVLFPQLLS